MYNSSSHYTSIAQRSNKYDSTDKLAPPLKETDLIQQLVRTGSVFACL